MKYPTLKTLALCSSLALVGALPALAEDDVEDVDQEVEQVNQETISSGEQQNIDRIAASFGELAGSEENTQNLINGLRNGTEITMTETVIEIQETTEMVDEVDADGNPVLDDDGNPVQVEQVVQTEVEVENTITFTPETGQIGFGGAFISLALAEEKLNAGGIEDPTLQELVEALAGDLDLEDGVEVEAGILEMRADGMGWGKIANELDFNLGQLISSLKSARPDKAEKSMAMRGDRPEKTKAERPARPERAERPEKPEKPEKPERPERAERPEKPEKPERPGRG
ncbi:hypothetical protein QP938_03450 [Porticoccaceae bacterium LTM1]|nr:hypothetical protein QP938_03450 [Porticoccaceae bacterium LTM1]